MEVERLTMPDNSWRAEPIPGAPSGKCWRMCDKPGHTSFYLVKAFHGILIYQCLECRKMAEVVTRTGKTCMNCGKPLVGRQRNWCCPDHSGEVWACHDRETWRRKVLNRDAETCQQCGWHETEEGMNAFREAYKAIESRYRGLMWDQRPSDQKMRFEAMQTSGRRQLEVHHITPLEWGGPEFDPENGQVLCHLCHDQVHREFGTKSGRQAGTQHTGGKENG